ncbi:protein HEADING DATE REPRESSOR 1 isoform X2 [Ananas comosus]|uniref:Protein HEADING DATE REPRESSOR 1 isoform X2 n=2 Tax=Ananas comosus TaxID=4615 RepID=A0A199VBF0_ANACO|nr:protein HEADING DATE REPRESSOR 1 isoform X2 [Ananas comosus]OAY74130.1 hypothetical protein ACMD2_14194 [Ananas comosus]CAD1825028.1 unnamed protein product [Ananas comosus var. bracteatus]
MDGFSPSSPPRIFWNSRKRSASGRSLENALTEESLKAPNSNDSQLQGSDKAGSTPTADAADGNAKPEAKETALSARRRALFEPLEPANGRGIRAEDLLPPPDFDSTSYPKGWLVGKKRKLVNVDVVESMRRIAVQEMNRKDREINGLNEQLEEDSRALEHLQQQLLQERSKRTEVERENAMLQEQISMLVTMLDENQAVDDEVDDEPPADS